MSSEGLLLADIGGTNARFAMAEQGRPGPVVHLSIADFATPHDAIGAALEQLAPVRPPRRAALAVAGPVAEGQADLTNGAWHFDGALLGQEFDLESVRLINDFSAVAHALPHLTPEDLVSLGGGLGDPTAAWAVIGAGTGLGVSGLLIVEGRQVALAGEGGHASLAAADSEEAALFEHLRQRFEHISAERLRSGGGLVLLYEAIAERESQRPEGLTPAEVTARALAGSDPHCRAALSRFCALLGGVAGNLALTLGARGGVYLAGGIAPRIVDFLQRSDFRRRFEAKGRCRSYLEPIPSLVIIHPNPALVGLIALAAQGDA